MKRTRPSDIKQVLAERAIQPSRVLGQNFLVDENILNIIMESAHIDAQDIVLEIGPGLGVLTEALVADARRVIAIEKDPRLAAYVRETFGHLPNFHLIEDDALKQNLPQLLADEEISHVISNLPYSSGTRILMELIEAPARPLRVVVMLQTDVAERMVAPMGGKDYGLLSIHAQRRYDVLIRKTVSPSCFYPPPEVKSAIVELYRLDQPLGGEVDDRHFAALIKWCFSQRRKQIGRILTDAPGTVRSRKQDVLEVLAMAGLQPDQRPEAIDILHWCALSRAISPKATSSGT
jgi:16S rRNA (adenine1518-N6/adenine1519-N6)-dimethyltransferase